MRSVHNCEWGTWSNFAVHTYRFFSVSRYLQAGLCIILHTKADSRKRRPRCVDFVRGREVQLFPVCITQQSYKKSNRTTRQVV